MMTLASLTFWQARNRIRVRLARLKQPRYLVGSIVGIAYLGYFVILRNPGFSSRGRGAEAAANFARAAGPLELGVALLLLVLAALVWILPAARSPVRFSPSEIQFLFPAPITRRQLLQYRLLRAQLGLLFGSVMATIFMRPTSFSNSWKFLTGLWLILMTSLVYFTGVSLYREGLRQRGIAGIAKWAAVALAWGAVAVVAATMYGNWSVWSTAGAPPQVVAGLDRIVSSGAVAWILWPFRALTRLPLAMTTTAYLTALLGALAELTVLNGLAVLFPAWISTGATRSRGVDALGQRLFTTAGVLLALVFALVPATMVAGVVAGGISFVSGVVVVMIPAAVITSVLIVECIVVIEMLGRVLDRTDVSAVSPAE